MIPPSSPKRAFALFLGALFAFGPGLAQAQQAAGQLESAESQPDLTYENAPRRQTPGSVSASDAAAKRPSLTVSKKSAKAAKNDESAVPSYVGEDRAVTKPVAKPSMWDGKWMFIGANTALFGLLGFIALGPWGLLGGAIAGAVFGWGTHKHFLKGE